VARKTLEQVAIGYLDRLRSAGVLGIVAAYALLEEDNLDDSFPAVYAASVATFTAATAAALTATDEYMHVKAAAAGLDYTAHWQDGRPDAPTKTIDGRNFAEWMRNAPAGIKRLIADGMKADEAIAMSQARTINTMGTSVYQHFMQDTLSRFEVDALVARGLDVPSDLTAFFNEVEQYANLEGTRPTWERWRRVPSPGACSFCLMLASRSDYTSKDAASFSGGSGRATKRPVGSQYHDACRCTIAMVTESDGGMVLSAEDYERLTTRDADGNLPTFGAKGYKYTVEDFGGATIGKGAAVPERAPWADAGVSPRKYQPPKRKR
jgi:hypothetical protein